MTIKPTKAPRGFSFLYVIKTGIYFKVGMAIDFERRYGEFTIANPHPIEIVMLKKVRLRFIRHVEARAHELLSPYRLRGEWFVATEEQIGAAVTESMSRLRKWEAQYRHDEGAIITAAGHYSPSSGKSLWAEESTPSSTKPQRGGSHQAVSN